MAALDNDFSKNFARTAEKTNRKHKPVWALSILVALFAAIPGTFCCATDEPIQDNNLNCIASYTWDPCNPPQGRSTPFIARFENHYVLKTNKYLEAYVDLGQGSNNQLRLKGPMTLVVLFQLAKQWPMKAALISKWGFMEHQASYEFGLTADSKLYFTISPTGWYNKDVKEIISEIPVQKEVPTVACAVFEPSRRMAIYLNGKCVAESTEQIPELCYDSTSPVKLGPRFEGLLAGVWFYDKPLGEDKINLLSEKLSNLIPDNAPYAKWERLKRNIPHAPADYLGTTPGMKLYKEIDLGPYKGSFVCPGDLDNDGRIDFLLYKNGSSYTVPGRLVAINHDGSKLWEFGDANLTTHVSAGSAPVGQPGKTPPLRGIATIFDIDSDNQAEVISELWQNNEPWLYVLDGKTGQIEHRIKSPIDMSIRQPLYKLHRQPSRSHPVIRIAWLDGKTEPPSIILKYGASNDIHCHAFALDSSLEIRWHIAGTKHSMGHIPTVSDIDNDSKDEIILGHMLADDDGSVIWDKGLQFGWHADCTAAEDVLPTPGKEIFISVCGVGPVYCLSAKGNILWSKTREEVEHGQALWIANFLEDNPGKEVIACTSGHVGCFRTFDAATGKTLAAFEHKKLLPAYPDFPTVVNWQSLNIQSLWLPQDRTLVNGRGDIIAELGSMDSYVAEKLHCGTSWRPVGAQAFALDICGDKRDELILYEPYAGESIFIFVNPDSDTKPKPYTPQPGAYNIRSYF